MAMLEVKDLEVYYGVIQALKGISFDVDQGDIVALIGANGAGKTTTLHTITGLLNAKAGKIIYEGKDITHIPGYKLVSMGIAHVPEGRRVFATLSVLDDLQALPASGRKKEPVSRNFIRRRAADACYGPCSYEPSEGNGIRRAIHGTFTYLCK